MKLICVCLSILIANQILATHSFIYPSENGRNLVKKSDLKQRTYAAKPRNVKHADSENQFHKKANTMEDIIKDPSQNLKVSNQSGMDDSSKDATANKMLVKRSSECERQEECTEKSSNSSCHLHLRKHCCHIRAKPNKCPERDENKKKPHKLTCEYPKWIDDPVYGSDGKVYKNLFHLRCENIKRAAEGKRPLKFIVAPKPTKPTCGHIKPIPHPAKCP